VAQPGQAVEVAAGTYAPQQIAADSSHSSSTDVTFRPNGTVVVNCSGAGESCIDVYGSHITFDGGSSRNFKTASYNGYQGRVDTERGATDLTFTNMDIGAIAIGSSYTTISNSDLGPATDPLNIRLADGHHNTIENNLIHDFIITNGGHYECITWDWGTDIIIRNNEFRSCAIFSIFNKPLVNTSGIIENNVFWNPRGIVSTDIKSNVGSGATRCDLIVRYNILSEGVIDDCPGMVAYGNIWRSVAGASLPGNQHHNVTGVLDSAFINAINGNFRPAASSPARNAGDPANYPSTDKDGVTRTTPPDAGAYEG
jgi:hypothetical protein